MFDLDQQVYAGTDVGRVVYYDQSAGLVSVMHRKNDYLWYQKTYPAEVVTAVTNVNIPWNMNTPFQGARYVPRPNSWLDTLWSRLAA